MQRTVAVALLAACAVAGCGGCGTSSRPATTSSGAGVFATACRSCHSLIGNESRRKPGGDLLRYAFTRTAMLQFVREMPTPQPLDAAQVRAVVDYVLAAERRAQAAR